VVRPDRIRFYYTGFNIPYGLAAKDRSAAGGVEKGERMQRAIGLATLRLDGFLALRAAGTPGALVTRPLLIEGDALEVNAAVREDLRVEVQDDRGRALPGYAAADCLPIRGDGLRVPVRWRSNAGVAALRGRAARLRFVMTEGDLFAFGFR
jgi:hypothetical protein